MNETLTLTEPTLVAPTDPFAAKLADLVGKAKTKSGTPSLKAETDEDADFIVLSVNKRLLLDTIGPSKSEKTEGAMIGANTDFDFTGPDGRVYTFNLKFNAWSGVRLVGVKTVAKA